MRAWSPMRPNWKRWPSAFARIFATECTTKRSTTRLRSSDQRKRFVRFVRLRIVALVIADYAELDRKACVENVHVFRSNDGQHALGLIFGHGENDLQRLVGKLENVRSVMGAGVPYALRDADDRCTANAEPARLVQKPFADGLMSVLAILLGVERQLTAVHDPLPRATRVQRLGAASIALRKADRFGQHRRDLVDSVALDPQLDPLVHRRAAVRLKSERAAAFDECRRAFGRQLDAKAAAVHAERDMAPDKGRRTTEHRAFVHGRIDVAHFVEGRVEQKTVMQE